MAVKARCLLRQMQSMINGQFLDQPTGLSFFFPYTHSLSLLFFFFFFFFSFLKSQTTKQEVTVLVLLPWDPSLNELEVSTSSIP